MDITSFNFSILNDYCPNLKHIKLWLNSFEKFIQYEYKYKNLEYMNFEFINYYFDQITTQNLSCVSNLKKLEFKDPGIFIQSIKFYI